MTVSERSAFTRRQLLQAAGELLDEVGLGAITTRSIAERAGVNNALVHYHFGSKTALVMEAALARLEDELMESVRLVAGARSAGSGAAAVLRWLGTFDSDDPSMRTVVDLTVEALRNPEARPTIAALLEESRRELMTALEAVGSDTRTDGAGANGSAGDAERRGVADVLAALFDGALLHRLIDPELDLEPAAAAIETWLVAPPTAPPSTRGEP